MFVTKETKGDLLSTRMTLFIEFEPRVWTVNSTKSHESLVISHLINFNCWLFNEATSSAKTNHPCWSCISSKTMGSHLDDEAKTYLYILDVISGFLNLNKPWSCLLRLRNQEKSLHCWALLDSAPYWNQCLLSLNLLYLFPRQAQNHSENWDSEQKFLPLVAVLNLENPLHFPNCLILDNLGKQWEWN